MVIALILVIIFFQVGTEGKILFAQNINNLISQNAYVFVLATGMLLMISSCVASSAFSSPTILAAFIT